MDFNYKKIFKTALVLDIVGFVFAWLTCGWLFNWIYFLEPLSAWKNPTMGTTFMVTSLVAGFVLYSIFTGIYEYIRKGLPLKGIQKGLCFGLIVWLVGTLPGMWATYRFVNMNTTVVVYWLIQGLVWYLILGTIIAWFYER